MGPVYVKKVPFLAFAGARSAAGRPEARLVFVTGVANSRQITSAERPLDAGRQVQIDSAAVEPGTWLRAPRNVTRMRAVLSLQLDVHDPFRLYAGQPDPADPSRFTIDYACNGVRGTLVGTLGPDDTIALAPAEPVTDRRGFRGSIIIPAGSKRQLPRGE